MALRVITRTQLAAEWDISPNTVDNMLQHGQLRKVSRGLIDYDHAVAVRAAQDPVERERAMIVKAQRGEQMPNGAGPDPSSSGASQTLMKARTAKYITDARVAELNLKVAQGVLVDKAAVRQSAAEAGLFIVARLKALPSRLGPLCSTLSSAEECTHHVNAEIEQITAELQDLLAAI